MELTAVWNQFCLDLGDLLLGWALRWSPEAALVTVVLSSAVWIVGVRWWLTDQVLLRSVMDDRRCLRRRRRAARVAGDMRTQQICRSTGVMVSWAALRQEWKPLLLSLVPLAVLATWCCQRLETATPQVGDRLELLLRGPADTVGQRVHLVPVSGLESASWVRWMEPDSNSPDKSVACWQLAIDATYQQSMAVMRSEVRDRQHPLTTGRAALVPPLVDHSDGWSSELRLPALKMFGWITGIAVVGVPAWLVAFVLAVLPLVKLLKLATGVV